MLIRELVTNQETREGIEKGTLIIITVVNKSDVWEAVLQAHTWDGDGHMIYAKEVTLDSEIDDENKVLVLSKETWEKAKNSNLWNNK